MHCSWLNKFMRNIINNYKLHLTKSQYLKYIQCQKCLWLAKHRKELAPEISETQQAIFDAGYEVEEYAKKLFKKGANVEGYYEVARKHTQKFLKRGEKVIYQATALTDKLSAMADILVYNSKNKKWDIYEVKSSTKVKKDVHIPDLCFQKIAFEKDGFEVGRTFLICVNSNYVREGDIEPKKLLKIQDISEEVENMRSTVEANIPKALKFISQKEEPEVRILNQCKSPYNCAFMEHCLKDLKPNSIYKLKAVTPKKLNALIDLGIKYIKNIPEGFDLSAPQHNQLIVNKTGKPLIDKEMIDSTLGELSYPLYFLDYESYSSAIPVFEGTKSYQQVCFQYSLHVLRKKGGELEHYEYLHTDSSNPVEPLLESMKENIGPNGSVIVWHKSFEMGRNVEMGEMYPKYAEFMKSVNERVFDLKEIFSKQMYVDAGFEGSCSIKKVLPVIVPSLSYKELEDVQEGGVASLYWYKYIYSGSGEKDRIVRSLLKYCELDTLAMVEIWRVLC